MNIPIMKDLFENPFLLLAVCAITFLICIAITRAIFSIPQFIKYEKAKMLLLLKIAETKGVDQETLDKIIDVVEKRGQNNVEGEEKRIRYIYRRL